VKALDVGSMRTLFALAGESARCNRQGLASMAGLAAKPTDCTDVDEMLAPYRGQEGLIGRLAEATRLPEGIHRLPGGGFTSVGLPKAWLAEVRDARCFQTEGYSVGDRGLHSVTEQPGRDISLSRYLYQLDIAARSAAEATPAERDTRLVNYFEIRKALGEVIHRFFGDPGLEVAAARYAAPDHQAAIALLRERLTDPGFAPALNPLARAEIELLAASPADFISCVARRAQKKIAPGPG
jgi:hypothetical protein